jgi:nitrite reductase/ring-hydroxylating ferredoxin subunit
MDVVESEFSGLVEAVPVSSDETPLKKLRRRLARGAVEYARKGETAVAPAVLHEEVPFYLDPQMFAREQQRFFREMPLVACLSTDLPEPGSYKVFDDTGVPILATRGQDGQIRAFLNICPHRGARIVRNDCGKASRFTCRFHGWTFDTTGKTIGVPQESLFCGEIEAQKHLVRCPAEERHGLVFVQVTADSTMDLDAHLGDFDRELAMIELGKAVRVHEDDLPVTANWKYGLDTFFETYHLNSLHRETFKGLFSPVCVFETFGRHHRYTFAPLVVRDWVTMPESEWQVDLIPLQYFLFPNTILSVGSTSPTGSTVNIHRIFPQSVNHFVSNMKFCAMNGVKSPEHLAEIDASYKIARSALVNDDYSVSAESHRGFPALPPGTKLPVGRQEIGVQNFHRNVRELMER